MQFLPTITAPNPNGTVSPQSSVISSAASSYSMSSPERLFPVHSDPPISSLEMCSRLNRLLESIRHSVCKGFTALQCVDRNKACRCNEHLNGQLRIVAQQAETELAMLLQDYNRLLFEYNHEYYYSQLQQQMALLAPYRKPVEMFRCEWPNCNRQFETKEILDSHRRCHIRKSSHSCPHCSERLFSTDELTDHLSRCKVFTRKKSEQPKLVRPWTISPYLPAFKPNDQWSAAIPPPLPAPKSEAKPPPLIRIDSLESVPSPKEIDVTSSEPKEEVKGESETSGIKWPNVIVCKEAVSPGEYKRTRYSGIGRYRCTWPDCNYTPHFLRDLRRHMYKHTGEKRHRCTVKGCGFVSVWKTSLLQHQRKKHGIDTCKSGKPRKVSITEQEA